MALELEVKSAVEVCQKVGPLLLEFFERGRVETRSKLKRQDVVTQADLESEQTILDHLRREWPDDGILAEESGHAAGSSGRIWCVDPLDGTANFAAGYPHWSVAIALLDQDRPQLAVTHDPLRKEIHTATGRTRTESSAGPVGMRTVRRIEDALVADNRPYEHREPSHSLELELRRSRGRRESGSMALDFAWLAVGRLDLVTYERSDRLWDYIGGELLVENAGGSVRVSENDPNIAVAACPELAVELGTKGKSD